MLPQKRTTSARGVVGLFVVALSAAACGGSHGSAGAPPGTTAPAGSTATTVAAGAAFGTLPSPCGTGTAKGATANGVTDTTITIGSGDDAGYSAAPALDKELSDAVQPMIGW